MLKALYQTFLQKRRFLKNCSLKILRSYGQAWNAYSGPCRSAFRGEADQRTAAPEIVIGISGVESLSHLREAALDKPAADLISTEKWRKQVAARLRLSMRKIK